MFDTYKEIFEQRADSYHAAMEKCRHARDQEFMWAVKYLNVQAKDVICDVPSGGGYLSRHLNEKDCYFHFLETCQSFASFSPPCSNGTTQLCQFEQLPIKNKSIDRLISLAALHHVTNREQVFSEFSRVLKPSGRLLIVDVEENTETANFLNVFVDHYNSMGHRGDFLNGQVINHLKGYFELVSIERPKIQWCFDSEYEMVWFCRNLFGLDKALDQDIIDGVSSYLNPVKQDNKVTLDWQLTYLIYQP